MYKPTCGMITFLAVKCQQPGELSLCTTCLCSMKSVKVDKKKKRGENGGGRRQKQTNTEGKKQRGGGGGGGGSHARLVK